MEKESAILQNQVFMLLPLPKAVVHHSYSIVTTTDLVSTLSRGGTSASAKGFLNETCGQTVRLVSFERFVKMAVYLHLA
jgi:hypothetical protein